MNKPLIKDILRTMDYGPAPEAADAGLAWLDSHKNTFGHFIDGAFVAPAEGQHFETINPATGQTLASVAKGSEADIDNAVDAAATAFSSWSALPGHARARHLYAIARHVQKRERLLAVLETLDNGKPIRESRDIDVPLVARHFLHHAGWAELMESDYADAKPHGVCGQIIPWNFPLLMLAWKVAPALAAGNTVVLKPAEQTPLTALLFCEICREAGLPKGVLNVVTGDGATGALIVGHPGIQKIAFTGSTEVGRAIRQAMAGSGKALSLELGGKSPFIVFEDADPDSAVEGLVDAIWFNQGQVCCAGSRLLVQEGIAERFYAKLKARMEKLRVGDPLDKSIDMGAIVTLVQRDRIERLVRQACAEGATCWQPQKSVPTTGLFYPPTLLTDVEPASIAASEEIFGPVLAAMTFRTPDEAVALANNTRYGLAASIWSETIGLALDVANRVQAGVVWINSTNLFDAAAPFGGYRESGFGREGGREGFSEYLSWSKPGAEPTEPAKPVSSLPAAEAVGANGIDRTPKLYIGGKQVRPDAGHVYTVHDAAGRPVGQAALGSRKDIRQAVEAAHAAKAWGGATAHSRAQVLYYIAENLSARADAFADSLSRQTGASSDRAREECDLSIRRIFYYAAQADKFDGSVQAARARTMTLSLKEPFGVMGIVCPDDAPLLALVSLVMPAIAMGNRVICVPSTPCPLVATDLCQVLDTSDVPGGVINLVTGNSLDLAKTLAQHDDVAALWYFGAAEGRATVERESAGNLKTTWTGRPDWFAANGQGSGYLRRATQIKTVWIPYGE